MKREVTIALKIESVRVTSPYDIANGIKIKREVIVALQIESV
jgi:hypothetical protein